ncbi:MAG: hypothetical protein Athens071416_488 [Parcubacteria group bacterium Athens0714_16]|nr:MAG: hypothetical protein Athens071416_488 [Parcubacteria group bacterium Athens0714_16]
MFKSSSTNDTREVSVIIIRKSLAKTELMLKTLQRTISPKKITIFGNLGAKIKFDEKDMDVSMKLVDAMRGVNIDEEDKIGLVTRKNGMVESAVSCDRIQLENFLLA